MLPRALVEDTARRSGIDAARDRFHDMSLADIKTFSEFLNHYLPPSWLHTSWTEYPNDPRRETPAKTAQDSYWAELLSRVQLSSREDGTYVKNEPDLILYNRYGYDRDGYDRDGYDIHGVNRDNA